MTKVQKLAKIMVLKDLYKEYELLAKYNGGIDYDRYCALDMAIKALEQGPRKDEVILTNKEYRELMANEYDHGYCKGYAVALEEQESALDKIEEEIKDTLYVDSLIFTELIDFRKGSKSADDVIEEFNRVTRMEVLRIIDKYKLESEGKK